MPAPNGVPVFHTEIITEDRRVTINTGLQLFNPDSGKVEIFGGRELTDGDYDDIGNFLRVGGLTVRQWFSPTDPLPGGETRYRDCLPIEIIGRRPFRISPMPGYAPRLDEGGQPVEYDGVDLLRRSNMRYRLWLCATLGRTESGMPVGYEREPPYAGEEKETNFYVTSVSGCLRKMREIIEDDYTRFMTSAWKRFEIWYNDTEILGPIGWYLVCSYNIIGNGQESDAVENFPPVEEENGEVL